MRPSVAHAAEMGVGPLRRQDSTPGRADHSCARGPCSEGGAGRPARGSGGAGVNPLHRLTPKWADSDTRSMPRTRTLIVVAAVGLGLAATLALAVYTLAPVIRWLNSDSVGNTNLVEMKRAVAAAERAAEANGRGPSTETEFIQFAGFRPQLRGADLWFFVDEKGVAHVGFRGRDSFDWSGSYDFGTKEWSVDTY